MVAFTADLVAFNAEILNGKLDFLCSVNYFCKKLYLRYLTGFWIRFWNVLVSKFYETGSCQWFSCCHWLQLIWCDSLALCDLLVVPDFKYKNILRVKLIFKFKRLFVKKKKQKRLDKFEIRLKIFAVFRTILR